MTPTQIFQDQSLKVIVGVADLKVSANSGETIITYALGSCLGITAYDPVAQVGGLLHAMLPTSTIDPAKAKESPFIFVDTGFPRLLDGCREAGAKRERLIFKVAGGACARGNPEDDFFQIGKRNIVMLKKILWQNGLMLKAYDVGGNLSRTLSLEIKTGSVSLRTNGVTKAL